MRISRIIRKFDRFHFNGIPEQPESTWERDGHPYVEMRQTGKPQSSLVIEENYTDSIFLGTLINDYSQEKIVFVPGPELTSSNP